jgi:hypothetical protein
MPLFHWRCLFFIGDASFSLEMPLFIGDTPFIVELVRIIRMYHRSQQTCICIWVRASSAHVVGCYIRLYAGNWLVYDISNIFVAFVQYVCCF